MKFAVVISFLVTSGLTAPVETGLERNTLPKVEEASIPVAVLLVIPEQIAFRDEADKLMKLSPESALPLTVSEERATKNDAYEDPYVNAAAAYKPKPAVESGDVVATFSASVSPSAIPILLNCAPKVVTGNLAETKPTHDYRSVFTDITDILTQGSPVSNDFDLSDILGLDSPASAISGEEEDEERKKRNSLAKSGATRHKVSEDFPEVRQGNHHLVSEDYPRSNMVMLTPNQI